jgi:hypothetical protein
VRAHHAGMGLAKYFQRCCELHVSLPSYILCFGIHMLAAH